MIARLTRPSEFSAPDERRAYLQRLAQTLDDLGVKPGDEFVIGPLRAPHSHLDAHDENRQGAVRRDAGMTSRKAASAVAPRTGTQRHTILQLIAANTAIEFDEDGGPHGVTRDELAAALVYSENAIRPRVKELLDGGWIEETDRTRKTRTGHDAAVLVATDKGRRALAEVS